METNSEKKLTELHELGALQFNTQRLPVYCSHPPEQSRSNLNQIIRLLIQSVPENEHLKKITEQELQIACQSFPSPTQHSSPNHYKPPISRYGTAQFNDQDLHYLRQVRKDHTEVCSVDRIFDIIKRYHESNQHKFSEETWLDHLHIPMPVEARPLIYSAQRLKSPLSLLFEDLSNKFSKVRDNPTIIASIFSITKHPTNLLTMLEEMANLIDSSCQNKEEIESLAIHEAFKTISETVGASGASSLKVAFLQQQRQTIRNLLHLANIHFKDLLNTKSKLHHITEDKIEEKESGKMTEMMKKIDSLAEYVKGILEQNVTGCKCQKRSSMSTNYNPSGQEKRSCYYCGATGHIRSQCKKLQGSMASVFCNSGNYHHTQARPPTDSKSHGQDANRNIITYREAPCCIHTNSQHKNIDCVSQKSPCTYRESHKHHRQAECTRTNSIYNLNSQPKKLDSISPAKTIFEKPECSTVPPSQFHSDGVNLDQATKTKLIDLISQVK